MKQSASNFVAEIPVEDANSLIVSGNKPQQAQASPKATVKTANESI